MPCVPDLKETGDGSGDPLLEETGDGSGDPLLENLEALDKKDVKQAQKGREALSKVKTMALFNKTTSMIDKSKTLIDKTKTLIASLLKEMGANEVRILA